MNVAPAPILTLDEAAEFAEAQRAAGRVVVMTNGVFDLMHPGHVRYLEAARAEGDLLIVAVNSDRTVRENKGPARPILPEAERAELLAALACVDAVLIFDDLTPADRRPAHPARRARQRRRLGPRRHRRPRHRRGPRRPRRAGHRRPRLFDVGPDRQGERLAIGPGS